MSFASIWPQPRRGLDSGFGLGEPGRSMIGVAHRINTSVRKGELAVSIEKRGVALHCLVKKLDCFLRVLLTARTLTARDQNSLGPAVKVESR